MDKEILIALIADIEAKLLEIKQEIEK